MWTMVLEYWPIKNPKIAVAVLYSCVTKLFQHHGSHLGLTGCWLNKSIVGSPRTNPFFRRGVTAGSSQLAADIPIWLAYARKDTMWWCWNSYWKWPFKCIVIIPLKIVNLSIVLWVYQRGTSQILNFAMTMFGKTVMIWIRQCKNAHITCQLGLSKDPSW